MDNLISVIIPAYNKAEELRAVLASLLAQTHKEYEVIIVNDGSTDSTAHVIENFKNRFWERKIRFKIIQQNNQGAPAARNRGLVEGRGQYVIFWDADVVASPECLQKMKQALEANPQAAYAYSSFLWGKKKFKLWEFDAQKLKKMPYIHTTSLVRASDFPGWDTRVTRLQDWDVWLTMLERGQTGVWIDEILFTVLVQQGTMSRWLPKLAYKLTPWLKDVQKYNEAVEVIKRKHKLNF